MQAKAYSAHIHTQPRMAHANLGSFLLRVGGFENNTPYGRSFRRDQRRACSSDVVVVVLALLEVTH